MIRDTLAAQETRCGPPAAGSRITPPVLCVSEFDRKSSQNPETASFTGL